MQPGLARQEREAAQQVTRGYRFPRHVLGDSQAHDVTGRRHVVQEPDHVLGRQPAPAAPGLGFQAVAAAYGRITAVNLGRLIFCLVGSVGWPAAGRLTSL